MATNRIKEFVRQNQRPRRGEPLMPWLSKELMTKFKSCLYLSVLLYPRKAAWNWKKIALKKCRQLRFLKSHRFKQKNPRKLLFIGYVIYLFIGYVIYLFIGYVIYLFPGNYENFTNYANIIISPCTPCSKEYCARISLQG